MSDKTNALTRIAVVGAGTVGAFVSYYLSRKIKNAKIFNIASSKTPIVGVGEGVTGHFRRYLLRDPQLGLSEEEFIRETKAYPKTGLLYKNWFHGRNRTWGPFDQPYLRGDSFNIYNYSFGVKGCSTQCNPNTILSQQGKTGFVKGKPFQKQPAELTYGLHFDGKLVSEFFKKRSDQVEFIDDLVVGKVQEENGNISAIELEERGQFEADFFVDCSGFSKVLTDGLELGVNTFEDQLPLNAAMPFIRSIPRDVGPQTNFHSMNSGWMWEFPVGGRMGMGYVFNESLTSFDEAQVEVEQYLGTEIEPIKQIRFTPTIYDQFWTKNLLILGLSSSFIEPLEATSIHGALMKLIKFAEGYVLRNGEICPELLTSSALQNRYNGEMRSLFSNFFDFIQLHYLGTGKETEFWRYMSEPEIWSNQNRFLYEKCRHGKIMQSDFDDGFGYASHQLMYPTLLEMGWASHEPNRYSPDFYARSFMQYEQKMSQWAANSLTISEFSKAFHHQTNDPAESS